MIIHRISRHLAFGKRYGKRSAFPTSPHPRRRLRTNFKRGATLTIYLVQKIGQVNLGGRFGLGIASRVPLDRSRGQRETVQEMPD